MTVFNPVTELSGILHQSRSDKSRAEMRVSASSIRPNTPALLILALKYAGGAHDTAAMYGHRYNTCE